MMTERFDFLLELCARVLGQQTHQNWMSFEKRCSRSDRGWTGCRNGCMMFDRLEVGSCTRSVILNQVVVSFF